MNIYERLFGSGPRGALIGTVLFMFAYFIEDRIMLPKIFNNDVLRYSIFLLFIGIGIIIAVWSLKSLPIKERGRTLITIGAFQYFRHPLYAAFASFINIGFSVFLNNWIYLLWVAIMFPVWAMNVKSEEKLMQKQFGKEYEEYCERTWRFFPKFYTKKTYRDRDVHH